MVSAGRYASSLAIALAVFFLGGKSMGLGELPTIGTQLGNHSQATEGPYTLGQPTFSATSHWNRSNYQGSWCSYSFV